MYCKATVKPCSPYKGKCMFFTMVQLSHLRILFKCMIYDYLLKDLLGEGGEHTIIRKTLKRPHLSICNRKY